MTQLNDERRQWLSVLDEEARYSDKSWNVAFALSCCLGLFGADRLYLGHTFLGTLKLCTCGGLTFWWFIDIFLLATGAMRDGENRLLKR